MGFLDKLKFWGKKKEPGLEKAPEFGKAPDFGKGEDIKLPEFGKSALDVPPEEFGKPIETTQYGKPPFPEHEMTGLRESAPNVPRGMQQQPWQGFRESSEMQVISAKLDALKASLDSINQRLANLERIAQGEQPQRRWQYRY